MQIAKVKYWIAAYCGEIDVACDENDDNDAIIAKAKKMLGRNGGLPCGSQSFRVIERLDD
jgi:hypothetical protein